MGVQVRLFDRTQPGQPAFPVLSQQPQNLRFGVRQWCVVDAHQADHLLPQGIGCLQPAQDGIRQAGAPLVVPRKVGGAVRPLHTAEGFGHVVQQRCPAQDAPRPGGLVLLYRPHRHRRVLPHVIAVPFSRLSAADAGVHLRDSPGQNPTIPFQYPAGRRAVEQTVQLGKNPLFRHRLHCVPQPLRRGLGGRINGKIQLRRKADGPQDAQRVLGKAGVRVPDAPDDPGLQIPLPAKAVHQSGIGVPGHGIDGKVPPGQILFHPRHKANRIRVSMVGIRAVHPEGGDLVGFACKHHRHRTMFQAGQQQTLPRKDGPGLFRQGAGCRCPSPRVCAPAGCPARSPPPHRRDSRPGSAAAAARQHPSAGKWLPHSFRRPPFLGQIHQAGHTVTLLLQGCHLFPGPRRHPASR